MESDDFAYYLERHRGNFFFVGSGGEDPGTRHPHHHPAFDLDERAITTIITTYLALVLP
jgi:amidohydrolase